MWVLGIDSTQRPTYMSHKTAMNHHDSSSSNQSVYSLQHEYMLQHDSGKTGQGKAEVRAATHD